MMLTVTGRKAMTVSVFRSEGPNQQVNNADLSTSQQLPRLHSGAARNDAPTPQSKT
jgi:hypothetical protein